MLSSLPLRSVLIMDNLFFCFLATKNRLRKINVQLKNKGAKELQTLSPFLFFVLCSPKGSMQDLGQDGQGLYYCVAPQFQQFSTGLCSDRRSKWEMKEDFG